LTTDVKLQDKSVTASETFWTSCYLYQSKT